MIEQDKYSDDYDQDLMSKREYKGFILEAFDPYGFWKIRREEGSTPQHLKDQQFTEVDLAKRAVDIYIDSLKTKIEETEKKIEQATYKKPRKQKEPKQDA